jgi:serine/threonine protein kinase/predicted esterase
MIHCASTTVQKFLNGQLDLSQEASLVEHLDACDDCRHAMEAMVAPSGGWSEMKSLLETGSATYDLSSDFSTSVAEVGIPTYAQDMARYVKLHPSDDPSKMGRMGTMEIIGVVGRGGMGIVFKAHDTVLSRIVAIKVLDPMIANLESARKRFARESRAMASISHEHIVPVYAVDEHRQLPYLVMEYVPGGTLENRLAQGPMDAIEITRSVLQIAKGLEAAHRVGIIHRDIKPSNILLDSGTERIRVADFGLARGLDDLAATRSFTLVGTPQFMSPEQVRGDTCDARSDLFSLGSLMFALCTGNSPFQADGVYATMQRIVNDTPFSIANYRNDLPDWMLSMTDRLLAKEPCNRFQSAEEVVVALEQELSLLQGPSRESPSRPWLIGDPSDRVEIVDPSDRAEQVGLVERTTQRRRMAGAMVLTIALASVGGFLSRKWIGYGHTGNDQGFSSTALASAAAMDDDQDLDPMVVDWVNKLVNADGHNAIAFNLGPRMLDSQPKLALDIAETAWPRLRDRYQKTALLKTFQFASHEDVLQVLHLGMNDADPDVRDYADSYLSEYSFRSFKNEPEAYQRWVVERANKSVSDVFFDHYNRLANEYRQLSPKEGLQKWQSLNESIDRPVQRRESFMRSGLPQVFLDWLSAPEPNATLLGKAELVTLLNFFTVVPLSPSVGVKHLEPWIDWDDLDAISIQALIALSVADPSRSFPLLSRCLHAIGETGGTSYMHDPLDDVIRRVSQSGDDRFIPLLIGLIDADNSYDTIYGIGYFGLHYSKMAERTGVRYSSFHDGKWWQRWWERNQDRFSQEARALQIPDFPKTVNGSQYKTIEEDIETIEGRMALAERLIRERAFDSLDDIAQLFVANGDQKAIPLLIGIIESDNSSATVYGIGYFGLQSLVKPMPVMYSPFHDGAWWRRWWERNKTNFAEEIQSQTIPVFEPTAFGSSYTPYPDGIDTPEGRIAFAAEILAEPKPDVRRLCELFESETDPRDLAALISLRLRFEGKPESDNAQQCLSQWLRRIAVKSVPATAKGWREWWTNHRDDWPETKELEIIDFDSKDGPVAANEIDVDSESQATATKPKIETSPDSQKPASQLHQVPGQKRMEYLLIGGESPLKANTARRLLVVLPGGDGGKDFEPFVRAIYENALDASWIIAQPISVKWFDQQEIVWPTKFDRENQDALKQSTFSTEEFIDAVITDVAAKVTIDPKNIFTLGWSSSGPALYAHSLSTQCKATGAYIAMSVFKPKQLPDVAIAKGRRFVIDHSPQDKVCPYRMAQQARATIEQAGGIVQSIDYTGGHGWQDDPLRRLKEGLNWLLEH